MNRLVSWKRIARYLDRGERTVRRWASEDGLPVHRVCDRPNSSVFAFSDEIDRWLEGRAAKPAEVSKQRPIVALLPFNNFTGRAEFDTLIDGLTEEVISMLGQVGDLGVIARTSVAGYKDTSRSIKSIGAELNAQYIIEGSVRIEANTARVTTQLISVKDQTHLWAQNYGFSLTSPMAMQQHIALQLANDVSLLLTSQPAQFVQAPQTIEGPGSEEYFQGRILLNKLAPESLQASVEAFDRAIAVAPDFGPAYGGKAEAMQLLTSLGQSRPADVMPEAIAAINKAVALSPNSAEVFASLAYIHSNYTRQWAASEEAFQQSLRLNPNLAVAHQWYAELLAVLGRFDEALIQINEAGRLDPLSLAVKASKGHVWWLARRYDELIPAMQALLDMESDYPLATILLFCAHFEQQDYDLAHAVCEGAASGGNAASPIAILGELALGAQGQPDKIRACLKMLESHSRHVFISHFFFALLYSVLGEADQSIDHLQQACDEGVWHVAMLGQSATFDGLRKHPRFDELLGRIGLYDSRFIV